MSSAVERVQPTNQAWTRFFDPYYLGNVGLLAGWVIIREYLIHHSDYRWSKVVKAPQDLLVWESRAGSMLACAAVVKFFRRQSLDGFLTLFFLYAKSAVLLLIFISDIRMFGYYLVLFWMHMMFTRQPIYRGPSEIMLMNPLDFKSHVTGPGIDKEVHWLVEFYTLWHPSCVAIEPVMAELSLKYATPGLRFGKLDVSRYPQIAEDLGISLTGTSRQLPTLVMFKGGKELARIPHVYEGGKVAKGVFRRKAIEDGFDLKAFSELTKDHVPREVRVEKSRVGSTKFEGTAPREMVDRGKAESKKDQ